ncbi:MAG TPA: DUF3108 domain-containing protein [Candidatus Nanopelagicales bacterium]|nr:DUF3108 domain-containing protein [Candidatus Nanopelagicales bacterium]
MKLLALLLLAALPALAVPVEITAQYELTNKGITIGRVSESFVRKGDTYTISSVTRSEGILKIIYDEQITLQSAGKVNDNGLQPLRFEERRTREPKRDVSATFDWERGVLESRFRGETTQHALPRETQDRLSMMYQFMHLKPRSGNLVMAMSNGRKIEHYTYRLVDEVRITTPMGEFDTLHVERVTYGPKESKAEVWLAKDHHNIPVRVVFDDPRGLRLEQNIVALQTR